MQEEPQSWAEPKNVESEAELVEFGGCGECSKLVGCGGGSK
jgi:hypothetical protein